MTQKQGGFKLPDRRLLIRSGLGALALFLSMLGYVGIVDSDGDGTPDVVTITLPNGTNPQAPPTIEADKDTEFEASERWDAGDATPVDEGPGIHEDMRDEQPAGAPPNAADRVLDTSTSGLGQPLPLGGAQNYSCPRRWVVNFSTRAPGSRVELFNLHLTVSRPGTSATIWRLFNTPSFGSSSHLLLEPSGECKQIVPFEKKAWTQGAFNSVSESVEIMAMGTEPRSWWLAQPILKNGILAAIVADRLRARGIPPHFVDPVGCGVQQAGWTDHHRLECGNTHHDVHPHFPYDVLQQQIVRAYGGDETPATPGRPLRCTSRNIEAVLARRLPRFKIIVDGKIGGRTRAAIREFQRVKRLPVDGEVGPQTGAVLGLAGC
jgi:peptidoglycan hydrolase-like protein with peptidoglycan-binding domain